MRMYEASLIVIAVVVGIAVIAGVVSQLFWGADNPVEQIAESVIEEETGQKVDLSPEKATEPVSASNEQK